jgi:hypothetical protein
MRIDPESLRRHYESLSSEGLLDIDRADLTPLALGVYDQEVARRGLKRRPQQEREQEEEAYRRLPPVFKPGGNWDSASDPGDDTDGGPPPAWLEDAACSWSAYVSQYADYIGTGAEVQAALREAGIPNRIVVKPPEPEPPSTPRSLYCAMVPGDLGTRACAVVERKVFNRMAEAEWRSQLEAFSDEQLRALNPEDIWGALLDKAERMKRAYFDEIARRKPPAAASQ